MDGSGKSTVGRMMGKELSSRGMRVLCIEHPNDDCRFGRMAHRYLLRRGRAAMMLSTAFYVMDVFHSLRLKKRHSGEYDDVIFIRYDLAAAYLPDGLVEIGSKFISLVFPKPDLSIFVDVDPETAMERIIQRGGDLEMFETVERLTEVRNKMMMLTDGWVVVDNDRDRDRTERSVRRVISEFRRT